MPATIAREDRDPRGQTTIFVLNQDEVTAFPATARGNVSPVALTRDMAAPQGIAHDSSGRIYISNSATSTIAVYPADTNGNVAPLAVIGGPKTGLTVPGGVALDPSGDIYVLNVRRKGYSHYQIAVFPPLGNAVGILDEPPLGTIAGPKAQLDFPAGIAIDSRGYIYVANEDLKPGSNLVGGRITVYSPGSKGDVGPVNVIGGKRTQLAIPVALAVDPAGDIYVANRNTVSPSGSITFNPSVSYFPAGSSGNTPPAAVISDDTPGTSIGGLAVDASGNLAVSIDSGSGAINVYAPGSDGNAPPIASIAGAQTGLNFPGPGLLVFDSDNSLYVVNETGGPAGIGNVTVYGQGSNGNVAPIATFSSGLTGIDQPGGIAVDSSGRIYVANQAGGSEGFGDIAVYAAGSYATDSPLALIDGPATGLDHPYAIALNPAGDIAVNGGNAVTEYLAASSGNTPPLAAFNINANGKQNAAAIAFDSDRKLVVANQEFEQCHGHSCFEGAGNVAVYTANSSGSAAPKEVISGPNTRLATPSGVALDSHGDIYVANQGPQTCLYHCSCFPSGPGSITVYPPGSKGDVAPIATISGPRTRLQHPEQIALDSKGNIYVLNTGGTGYICVFYKHTVVFDQPMERAAAKPTAQRSAGAPFYAPILIFAAGSNGDTPPIGAIGGELTDLNYPLGIAAGPGSP